MVDWQAIVGPALVAVTQPRRLAAGTLTLACSGPIALELQHLAPELISRINGYLGRQAVQALRFVQTEPARVAAMAQKPVVNPEAAKSAAAAVADLPEGPLRDALSALGRAVLSRALPVATRRPG
jgi:hypothetical protein